jgi:putative heme degradation protein
MADLVISLYEGALIVARVEHDVRPMRAAADAVVRALGATDSASGL